MSHTIPCGLLRHYDAALWSDGPSDGHRLSLGRRFFGEAGSRAGAKAREGATGGGEDAAAADMKRSPGDLLPRLRDHQIAFEGAGGAAFLLAA